MDVMADVWARVVTPTSEVPDQHTSRAASSPAVLRATSSPKEARVDNAHSTLHQGVRMRARLSFGIILVVVIALTPAPASGEVWSQVQGDRGPTAAVWRWPIAPPRIERPYVAPVDRFSSGHRGIDLAAAEGSAVRAPAPGLVVFSGAVVDRHVLTIDHGDGYVTTLEPVSEGVAAGTSVAQGDIVALSGRGGHVRAQTLHFGVRYRGEYINPLLVLGGVPGSVLLPCC